MMRLVFGFQAQSCDCTKFSGRKTSRSGRKMRLCARIFRALEPLLAGQNATIKHSIKIQNLVAKNVHLVAMMRLVFGFQAQSCDCTKFSGRKTSRSGRKMRLCARIFRALAQPLLAGHFECHHKAFYKNYHNNAPITKVNLDCSTYILERVNAQNGPVAFLLHVLLHPVLWVTLGALDTGRSPDLRSAECASLTTRILHNSPLQSVTGVWT